MYALCDFFFFEHSTFPAAHKHHILPVVQLEVEKKRQLFGCYMMYDRKQCAGFENT